MLRERERKINKKFKKWFYALAGEEEKGAENACSRLERKFEYIFRFIFYALLYLFILNIVLFVLTRKIERRDAVVLKMIF